MSRGVFLPTRPPSLVNIRFFVLCACGLLFCSDQTCPALLFFCLICSVCQQFFFDSFTLFLTLLPPPPFFRSPKTKHRFLLFENYNSSNCPQLHTTGIPPKCDCFKQHHRYPTKMRLFQTVVVGQQRRAMEHSPCAAAIAGPINKRSPRDATTTSHCLNLQFCPPHRNHTHQKCDFLLLLQICSIDVDGRKCTAIPPTPRGSKKALVVTIPTAVGDTTRNGETHTRK